MRAFGRGAALVSGTVAMLVGFVLAGAPTAYAEEARGTVTASAPYLMPLEPYAGYQPQTTCKRRPKPGVLLRETENLVIVPNSGRLVAALGVRDLIIVDTPDAVLVCPRDRAQEVKSLVDALKEKGDLDYI